MRSFTITVTQKVDVELDETKFDDNFMQEFRASFYQFYDIEDHAKHIAQLEARGITSLEILRSEFIEGYGPANEMGIKACIDHAATEVDIDT